MPEHVHEDHAMLLLPLVSPMTVSDQDGRVSRPLEPHFFYFVDADLPHSSRAHRDRQEHVAVYLNADWQRFALREAGLLPELPTRSGIWRLSETAFDLTRILVRGLADGSERNPSRRLRQVSELLAEECLISIQTAGPTSFGHPAEHNTALVMEVLENLRGNLAEPPSLDGLADRFAVSRRHLTRVFRDRTGQSIGAFLRRERFREAKRLLVETDWSVQQIASMVGTDNAANFASGFKREFGLSPSQFRRQQGLARFQK